MTDRAGYIAGLRALADALQAHPELKLPFEGTLSPILVMADVGTTQREALAAWTRVLPGRKDKRVNGRYFELVGAFDGLRIRVLCDRDEVCERVVVGTREVTEDVPDPVAAAAVPTVTVTRTEEVLEWRCSSILAAEAVPAGAR